MLNISTIPRVLKGILDETTYFRNEGFRIERSAPEQMDPNYMPWVGIYRNIAEYEPRSIGTAQVDTVTDNWTGSVALMLVVKDALAVQGECDHEVLEDRIELHIKNVLDVVVRDRTFRGVVDMVTTIKVSYDYTMDDEESMYMYSAIIDLELEVTTS